MKMKNKVFLLVSALSIVAVAGSIGFLGANVASAEENKPDKTSETTSVFAYKTGASIRLDTENTGADNTTGIRFIANIGDDLRNAVLENGAYKDGCEVGIAIVPAKYFEDYANQTGENSYNDYFEYFEEVKGKSKASISTQYEAQELGAVGTESTLKAVIVKLHDNSYNIEFQSIAYYYDGETYYYSAPSDARTVSFVASAALADSEGNYDTKALGNILTKAAVLKNGWSFGVNDKATVEVELGKTLNLKETFGAQIDADDLAFTLNGAPIENGVLECTQAGDFTVKATAFNGSLDVEILVHVKGIPVENSPAELYVLTNTGVLGAEQIVIQSEGAYEGKDNVSKITWNTDSTTRNSYPVRIVGVDKDWSAAQGVKSIKMNVWMEEGSALTVFNYPGNDSNSATRKGATLTLRNDVKNNTDWLAVFDKDGNRLTDAGAPYGQWVTVMIDTTIAGTLAGSENLNIVFRAEAGKTVYFADVEFLNVEVGKAAYTVEHYKQSASGYVLDESLTQTLTATIGNTVTAEYIDVDGYLPFPVSDTVSSGEVTLDGLTLKLYYNEAVKVANTDGKGYLYPLSGDYNFGAKALTIEKQSQAIAGVENAYKLTSTDTTISRIVGVDKAYATQNNYKTLKFSIYLDSFDNTTNKEMRPLVKLSKATGGYESNIAYLTSQSNMKAAENYVRIYNADGVRMSQVLAGQWCTVEVDLTNVGDKSNYPRIHVEIHTQANNGAYSYYIANATLSTDSFGKADSPIAVTYNGETVGAMVTYQGGGTSGMISDTKGMRLTTTAVAGKDCVKVDMLGAVKARNSWLQLQGLSSADITSMGITKISFDYYIDGTTNNPLLKMVDAAGGQQFFISPNAQPNTLVKVNGAQGKVASGVWCSVEVTLKNDKMVVGDWSGSAWKGLNLQLGADGGSFYIANVVLS